MRCGSCAEELVPGLRYCTSCGTPVTPSPPPTAPEPEPRCAACGTDLPLGVRFCVSCGVAVGSAPAPPPYDQTLRKPVEAPYAVRPAVRPAVPAPPAPPVGPPPSPPSPPAPPRAPRSRTALVVGAVVAVLLLGAGAGAGAVLLGGGEDESSATDEPVDPAPGEASDDPVPTTSAPPSTAAAAPTTAAAPVATVTCWNGDRVAGLGACDPLSGRAALRWVFPAMDAVDCAPNPRRMGPPRLQIWSCTGWVGDTPVDLNYSQWTSVGPARAHYDHDAEVTSRTPAPGGLIRWSINANRGSAKAALMYSDAPWSVTVYAPTAAVRDRAVRLFATMRPRGQLLGVRD